MDRFLVMTECCTPLLGRDILNSQNLSDFLPPTSTKSLIPIMTLLIKRGVAEIDIDINQVLNPKSGPRELQDEPIEQN